MEFKPQLAVSLAHALQGLYTHAIGANVVARTTDTQALVEKMPDGTFAVLFPGTDSVADWRTDLKVAKADWFGRRVHRGFAAAYESIQAGIIEIIPPGARVLIAGHSLGGALATLAAIRLNVLYTIEGVYTFGSPRVGNGPFAREYNELFAHRTFRLVNSGDPVPHIPWCFGTYRHVKKQVYLQADGRIVVDQFLAAVAAETAGAVAAYVNHEHLAFTLAKPHALSSYITKLNEGEVA